MDVLGSLSNNNSENVLRRQMHQQIEIIQKSPIKMLWVHGIIWGKCWSSDVTQKYSWDNPSVCMSPEVLQAWQLRNELVEKLVSYIVMAAEVQNLWNTA